MSTGEVWLVDMTGSKPENIKEKTLQTKRLNGIVLLLLLLFQFFSYQRFLFIYRFNGLAVKFQDAV